MQMNQALVNRLTEREYKTHIPQIEVFQSFIKPSISANSPLYILEVNCWLLESELDL